MAIWLRHFWSNLNFLIDPVVNRYSRRHSSNCLFKRGFVTSSCSQTRIVAPDSSQRGIFLFPPCTLTSLTPTCCTQRLLECSRVWGANEISQRSHQLCCQPQKCRFISRTLPPLPCHSVAHSQGHLCCVTSDLDPTGPFALTLVFLFVALKDAT